MAAEPARAWRLDEAPTQFREIVRRARSEGPQRLVDADGTTLVVSAEPPVPEGTGRALVDAFAGAWAEFLDLERVQAPAAARDVEV